MRGDWKRFFLPLQRSKNSTSCADKQIKISGVRAAASSEDWMSCNFMHASSGFELQQIYFVRSLGDRLIGPSQTPPLVEEKSMADLLIY